MLENINKLLNAGEIEQAFNLAIDLAELNGKFEKELRALLIRFSMINNKQLIGVLDQNDHIESNRIIVSFLETLEKIEKDLIENNKWIKKQAVFLKEKVFPMMTNDLGIFWKRKNPTFFQEISHEEIICIEELESKIDKEYWYVIHWRFYVILEAMTIYHGPKAKVNKHSDTRTIKDEEFDEWERYTTELFKSILGEYLFPMFAIKSQLVIGSAKMKVEIQSLSTMYPDLEELENYPWKKIH